MFCSPPHHLSGHCTVDMDTNILAPTLHCQAHGTRSKCVQIGYFSSSVQYQIWIQWHYFLGQILKCFYGFSNLFFTRKQEIFIWQNPFWTRFELNINIEPRPMPFTINMRFTTEIFLSYPLEAKFWVNFTEKDLCRYIHCFPENL